MKSYLKFLSRNKLYTAIEAVGLVVSLAFVIYMGCYVVQQFRVTRENPDYERIYLLTSDAYNEGFHMNLADHIKGKYPEIEQVCRYNIDADFEPAVFQGKPFFYTISCVDGDFFDMFPYYEVKDGSLDVFDGKNQVVVSETFAARLSNESVLGKTIVLMEQDYTIAAVLDNSYQGLFPSFDIYTNMNSSPFTNNPNEEYSYVFTFIKVAEGTDMEDLYLKIEGECKVLNEWYGEEGEGKLDLTRLDEIYFSEKNDDFSFWSMLFNRGNYKYLLLLIIVTVLVLISALMNYVNLNSALVGMRMKEMSVNQLFGARRRKVLSKYILESIFFTGVCTLLAILLAVAITPVMNRLINTTITANISFAPVYIIAYMALMLSVGFLNAAIPAFLATRYKPIDVIRGRLRASNKRVFSRLFIVFQAILTVVMISVSIVMEHQFDKAQNREIPLNAENIVFLNIEESVYSGMYSFDIMDRLRQQPSVKRVGYSQSAPGVTGGGMMYYKDGEEGKILHMYLMDSVAFNILDFDRLTEYGGKSVIGKWIGETMYNSYVEGMEVSKHILKDGYRGVIHDFPVYVENMGITPTILINVVDVQPKGTPMAGWVIETVGDKEEAIRQIKEVYKEWVEATLGVYVEPANCNYIDRLYRAGLAESERQMRLIEIFMVIAVLLSLMGMLAMSAYEAQVRRHDIALRKVHGATVGNEVLRGVLSYMKMVLAASVIAVPAAVWAADRYLRQFIVKIEGYWWIFAIAVLLTAVIALLSILWQILRAARTNPVDVLNKE